MHTGTAGGAEDDDGALLAGGSLDGTGDLFPHHAAHAGTEEAEVHDGQHHGGAFDLGPAGDDGSLRPVLTW